MAAKRHSLIRACFTAPLQRFLRRYSRQSKLRTLFALSLLVSLLVFLIPLPQLSNAAFSFVHRRRPHQFQVVLRSMNALENHSGTASSETTLSESETLGNADFARSGTRNHPEKMKSGVLHRLANDPGSTRKTGYQDEVLRAGFKRSAEATLSPETFGIMRKQKGMTSAPRDTTLTVAPRAQRGGESEHSDRVSTRDNDVIARKRTPSAQNAQRQPQPRTRSPLNERAVNTSSALAANQDGSSNSLLYRTDVPDSIPAWIRSGLQWTEGPIAKGCPHWQVVDTEVEVLVYSAHFDSLASPPLVRVVALLHNEISVMNVTCRFYDGLHGPSMHSVSGVAYHTRGLNGRIYISSLVSCPLKEKRGYLPYAVSVIKADAGNVTNFLIVHYSQSDSWLQQHNDEFFRKTRRTDFKEGQKSHDRLFLKSSWEETGSGRRWNITRCFPAIHSNFDDHVMLAEMVAASLAMGVERFVFYVQSAGPNVTRMLQILERKGIAQVHPWNLRLHAHVVFYAGQMACITDCLYRHLSSSRFVLFGDIDELFVPRKYRMLLPLLNDVLKEKRKCGAVNFRNVFFSLTYPRKALPHHLDPSGYALTHQLNMLTHTRRIQRVWPNTHRSKSAVVPRTVVNMGVHTVEMMQKGYEVCELPPGKGLLYHYRVLTRKQTGPVAEKEDFYLWNYASDTLAHVKDLLQDFLADSKARVTRQDFKPAIDIKVQGFKPATDIKMQRFKPATDIKNQGFKPATDIKKQGFKPMTDIKKQGFKPATDIKKQGFKPATDIKNQGFKPATDIKNQGFKPATDIKKQGFKPATDIKRQGFKPANDIKKQGFKPATDVTQQRFKPKPKR